MKGMKVEDNYLDLTLMELLDTDVLINLPSLILKYMQCVLTQDKNRHALPYCFCLSHIFEAYFFPVQVQAMQTTKDVLGQVNHVALLGSMQCTGTPLHQLKTALDAKTA